MSRLAETHDDLRGEWTSLQRQWESTRVEWRDKVAERFERDIWEEWAVEVPQFLNALRELDEVLDHALLRTSD